MLDVSNKYVPHITIIRNGYEMIIRSIQWIRRDIPTCSENPDLDFCGTLLVNIDHCIQANDTVLNYTCPDERCTDRKFECLFY